MRLLSVLGASQALGDHLRRHPDHWHELCDPTLGSTRPPAYALRASLVRSVGADPDDPQPVATLPLAEARDALRVDYRRLLLRLASRDLAHHLGVDDAAAELADLAAGHAGRRARRGPRAGGGGLVVVPARGRRDGQVRWPRAQLRQRRRRDLRGRARRRVRRAAGHARRHAARLDDDAGLLGEHPRGHHLAGRRQPASRGQVRSARPHPRQPQRLLRALGEDLGVPGTAQGATRRRRPRPRSRVHRGRRARWSGRRPSATASSRRCSRCVAGCSTTSRPTRPSGSSSSARAGCATSSSPYSCCRWCTAAPTRRCGRRRR